MSFVVLIGIVVGVASFATSVAVHRRRDRDSRIEVPLVPRVRVIERPMTPAELRQRAKLTVTREERDARARAKWREVSRRLNDVVSSGALPGSYIDSMTEQLQRTMAAALHVADTRRNETHPPLKPAA